MKPECLFVLQVNSQHTVPSLDDNGKYVSDSHAIITYLIGKYGKSDDHPLYPKDLYTRARIDQRLHFDTGILFTSLKTMMRPIIYEGAVDFTEKQLQVVYSAFDTVETFLAVDPYLVGNQLTVADLSCITTLTQLIFLAKLDATKYPKIAAYVKRLELLPYFEEINTANLTKLGPLLEMLIARNKKAIQQA